LASEIKAKEMQQATILATIESVNVTINSKLKLEDLQNYIDLNWPLDRLVKQINIGAEAIRKAENPPEPPNIKEVEVKPVALVKEQISITESTKPIQEPVRDTERLYFYVLKVVGNEECMLKLKKLIQSNGFEYETLNKGIVQR
jgi:hypothetical protein